jgi:DNA-directed RNA polymerase specialized sigma24 family protein
VGLRAGWLTGDAVELFEAERRRLFGLAYRLLGSASDAEGVLQGAFLAWNAADRATVAEPAAWLTTRGDQPVLERACVGRSRRERYVGTWLGELVLTCDQALGPRIT